MGNNNKKRNIPNSLAEKHEKQREKTKELVQQAILNLKDEGRTVNMKNLVEYTGLSRSTFSKPHVDEVLRLNRVCKYEIKNEVLAKTNKTSHELKIDIQLLESKVEKLTKKIKELEIEKNSLKLKHYEEKDRNEKLLGEIQAISIKCRMNNIRLEMIEIDNNTMLKIIK